MLTEFQRHKLTHFFRLLDLDKNDILELDDFSDIAVDLSQELGYAFEGPEHKFLVDRCVGFYYMLLDEIPHKGNQVIILEEWLSFFDANVVNNTDQDFFDTFTEFMIGFFFDVFDENNDGYISDGEYADLFLVYNIDIKYSGKSFVNLDANKDGRLSRNELIFAFETYVSSDDPNEKGNWIFGDWRS